MTCRSGGLSCCQRASALANSCANCENIQRTDTPNYKTFNPLKPNCCHTDWASECPDVKNYKQRLNPVWHRMHYSCTRMATVGFWCTFYVLACMLCICLQATDTCVKFHIWRDIWLGFSLFSLVLVMNNKKYLLVIGSVQLQQIDTALSWPVARSPS